MKMRQMRRRVPALAFWALAGLASAQGPAQAGEQRGKYLVERVGLCQDCHSPRDEQGAFVESRWLGGASIGFSPLAVMPWAEVAPPIAGLPTMTDEQGVRFLMSGEKPDGTRTRAPMPEYRFSKEDAEAVIAYLRSLPPPIE